MIDTQIELGRGIHLSKEDSIGLVGNIPQPVSVNTPVIDASQHYPNRTLNVSKEGRPIFLAAGNEIMTCTFDTFCGPPWVIAVGGIHPETRGESVHAAKVPDYVSDYVVAQVASSEDQTGYIEGIGTSYSAPTAAGTAAKILHEVRKAWNYTGNLDNGTLARSTDGKTLTAADLRLALNRTATYFGPSDYDVGPNLADPSVLKGSIPILPELAGTPVGPWLQMGWGYVSPAIVNETVAVLLGRMPLPEKPDAAAFLEQVFSLRETYWSTFPIIRYP